MTHQLSFDDARAARDGALAQVEAAADGDWKTEAWRFLCSYLETHEYLFVDDLWAAGLPHAREDRALGPLFNQAAKRGLMCRTGRSRPSVRSHLTDKPIWRSLIYCHPGNVREKTP